MFEKLTSAATCSIGTFVLLTLLGGTAQADVDIYRGVDAKSNGNATLSPGQFSFNPTLSNFIQPQLAPVLKPCNYWFTVILDGEPDVGAHGPVAGLEGYTALFDNDPEGHWGIIQPEGVSADDAKAAVSAFAQQNRQNVVNGTQDNCR